MPSLAVIALGSNLGDRLANLGRARNLFKDLSVNSHFLQAPIYETDPVSCPPGSQNFYNTVIGFSYASTPQELLAAAREIEQKLGRTRNEQRNAPRTLDADLLCLGKEVVQSDSLTLPHPRLTTRRFVLQPFSDICPDLVLPAQKQTIAELLSQLQSDEPPLRLIKNLW